jgi:hypothetical protein
MTLLFRTMSLAALLALPASAQQGDIASLALSLVNDAREAEGLSTLEPGPQATATPGPCNRYTAYRAPLGGRMWVAARKRRAPALRRHPTGRRAPGFRTPYAARLV